MPRLAIIANPISGGGRAFKKLKQHIKVWPYTDWEVELHATKCAEHAGVLARAMLERPPDLLAVCGGDGTLHEVISSVPAPPFPVAMLPSGTANVLARELELPLDPIQALELALKGVVRRVDFGSLRGRQQRHFLCMAGIGLDAYIAATVRPQLKRRIGMASYYVASARALMSYPFPEFHILLPGETLTVTWCLIANTHSYGGGVVFVPDADMNDGRFDVLYVQGKARMSICRFLFSAWRGKPRLGEIAHRRRLAALKIAGPGGLWVHADGELVGSLPQEVTLSPASFPLIVPG